MECNVSMREVGMRKQRKKKGKAKTDDCTEIK
jgi:hypothetical protein